VSAAEKLRPGEYTEAQAAAELGVSKSTLIRERLAGRIFPMRMGQRIIRYNDAILEEYRELCRNAPDKSVTSGLASGQGRSSGAEHGSTPALDKQSAHRLAQTIFKRRS
jgi:hypothetical protein